MKRRLLKFNRDVATYWALLKSGNLHTESNKTWFLCGGGIFRAIKYPF